MRVKLALILLSAVAFSATVHAMHIRSSEPRYLTAADFTRIGEYFGDPAQNPTRLELRTNASNRSGLYFIVELSRGVSRLADDNATAQLQVVMAGDKAPRTYSFAIPATKSQAHSLYLGLTDEAYNTPKHLRILAWKITLLDKTGKSIADYPSPLWQY